MPEKSLERSVPDFPGRSHTPQYRILSRLESRDSGRLPAGRPLPLFYLLLPLSHDQGVEDGDDECSQDRGYDAHPFDAEVKG
jgi:hypothetical protein